MKIFTMVALLMMSIFTLALAEEKNTDVSFYTGTFDTIDKEGDDQAKLYGLEHRDDNLFRNTFLGRLSPLTGAFVTDKNSLYVYSGVEGNYGIGRLKLRPSFSPGYYEPGDGKNLGAALEFKSEVRVDFEIFNNSKLGYSYSHISNNDWGDINPGTDNQHITFSQNF
jgi:lipid A 3-O-deacylase|tara:strand:- start:1310 stop:1810 length:501 start_codon:yes stop_codon:yes gene_type:complete